MNTLLCTVSYFPHLPSSPDVTQVLLPLQKQPVTLRSVLIDSGYSFVT